MQGNAEQTKSHMLSAEHERDVPWSSIKSPRLLRTFQKHGKLYISKILTDDFSAWTCHGHGMASWKWKNPSSTSFTLIRPYFINHYFEELCTFVLYKFYDTLPSRTRNLKALQLRLQFIKWGQSEWRNDLLCWSVSRDSQLRIEFRLMKRCHYFRMHGL